MPGKIGARAQHATAIAPAPRPGVAKPKRRQDVQLRRFRSAIRCTNPDEEIVRIDLGVFEDDIEVTLLAQNAGIPQFGFGRVLWPALICRQQLFVREARLRVAVKHSHVAVGRRAIGIEINFLHIFAVRPLRARHTEEPFLQERVAAVPESERETKPLLEIADAADAVLAPAERPRTRLVVRKIIPGIAVRAVILADRPPGALGQIRSPEMPALVLVIFREALLLGVHFAD